MQIQKRFSPMRLHVAVEAYSRLLKGVSVGLRYVMIAGLVTAAVFSTSVKVVYADGEEPAAEILPSEPPPDSAGPDESAVVPDIVLDDDIESISDVIPVSEPPDAGDDPQVPLDESTEGQDGQDPALLPGLIPPAECGPSEVCAPLISCDQFAEGDIPCFVFMPKIDPVVIQIVDPPVDCDPFTEGESPCLVGVPMFVHVAPLAALVLEPPADCDPFEDGDNPCPNHVRALARMAFVESTRQETQELPAPVVLDIPSETELQPVMSEPETLASVGAPVLEDELIAGMALQSPDAQMLVSSDGLLLADAVPAEVLGDVPVQMQETAPEMGAFEVISNNIISFGRMLFPDMLNVCSGGETTAEETGFLGFLRQYIRSLASC